MIGGKDRIYAWEDTYYEYSGSSLYFRVRKDGSTVYKGYAEKFPDGTPIRIYINRIARDYLSNGGYTPPVTGWTADENAYATFTLDRLNENGRVLGNLGSIEIIQSYHGEVPDAESFIMSAPVNGHADARMYLPVTTFKHGSVGPTPPEPDPEPDTGETKYFRWTSGIGFPELPYSATSHTITWETNYPSASITVSNTSSGVYEHLDATTERSLTIALPVNSSDTRLDYWARAYFGTSGRLNGYFYQSPYSGDTPDTGETKYFRWTSGIGFPELPYDTTSHTITWETNYSGASITVSNSQNGVYEHIQATTERSLTIEMPVNSGNTRLDYWARAYFGENGRLNGYFYQSGDSGATPTPPTPTGYTGQYFTIEMLSGGTIGVLPLPGTSGGTVYYSQDDGVSWTPYQIISSATTPCNLSVSAGDKILFKHSDSALFKFISSENADFNAYGNILSLKFGDDFATATAFTHTSYEYLFGTHYYTSGGLVYSYSACPIVSAENLILPSFTNGTVNLYRLMFRNCSKLVTPPALPATSLSVGCYIGMFQNCTSLTTAPVLPARNLIWGCYHSMFDGCTSLSHIKCLAYSVPEGQDCTTYWTRNVSSTGVFTKASGASWSSGVDGIPSGWRILID